MTVHTGSLLRPTVVGRDGLTLREKWSAGPVSHLGLGTHGFPNMFVIAGPGSPALLINVLVGIELHVDWLADLMAYMDARAVTVAEVETAAEASWVEHVNQRAQQTLYPLARSYYMGDEVPGKPRVFMMYSGGLRNYQRILADCVADSYAGFEFTKGLSHILEASTTTEATQPTGGSRRLPPLAQRRAALQSRHPRWVPRSLHVALDDAARRWGERPYVITDAATYSYTEIQQWSLRIARGLVGQGIRPGDHVGLEMANYPEFVACKFAISRAGATAVPINFLNRRDELAYALGQSRAVALIVMARHRNLDYVAMLDDIAPGWPTEGGGEALPDLRTVVLFENDGEIGREDVLTLAGLQASAPSTVDLPAVDPATTADILYTSGTTGGPKGVQLTHDMLLRTAYGAAYGRGFEDGRRIHFALPMYHVFGYVEGMLPAMFVGGAIIPHVAFDPVASLAAIEKHRATDMLAIPLMTQAVMDALVDRPTDLSSLASVLSSGTASPPGIWDRIDSELACDEVTTGYGMSETTASSTVTRPDDGPDKRRATNGRLRDAGVAGDPTLGGRLVAYRAVDPDTGQELGRGAIGELQAFGPGVTPGYWDNPDATSAAFTADGWLRTGDLGTIDEDDYVHLVGRLKDCYRCGGEQVVPTDIEDVLARHPGVAQALVVPVSDRRMGEVGVAFVVRRAGADVTPDELISLVADQLAKFKVPKHVLFLDTADIPVSASGRPRKFLLSEMAVTRLRETRPDQ